MTVLTRGRAQYAAALLVALGASALAGCSSIDPLGPGFEDDFARMTSCGDVYFFAVDAADEVMLTFIVGGPVAEARVAGEPITTTFDLPDRDVTLVVEQGSRISDAACDDVIENGGPRVSRTWTATAGTATLTVRPGATEFDARADLGLADVVFEDREGRRLTLDELTWSDASVGWLPG